MPVRVVRAPYSAPVAVVGAAGVFPWGRETVGRVYIERPRAAGNSNRCTGDWLGVSSV